MGNFGREVEVVVTIEGEVIAESLQRLLLLRGMRETVSRYLFGSLPCTRDTYRRISEDTVRRMRYSHRARLSNRILAIAVIRSIPIRFILC